MRRPDNLRARRSRRDESGAELIEFAFIATLLVALLYGIVFFGVTLGAKVTVTQAAADGSRAGIVSSTPIGGETVAASQAVSDLSWLGFSTPACGATGAGYACMSPCSSSIAQCTTSCSASLGTICPIPADAGTVALLVVALEGTCPSSTSGNPSTCLTTNVNYYEANKYIVPPAPGLSVVAPSSISSSSTLQISASAT
jgi:Flp pilus assembly protein TadG